MKKLTLILAFIFAAMLCTGQQINKAEYFIDSDPGYGLATPVQITIPGKDLSLSFQVNTSGLSQGFHMMVLRARDDLGRWSTTRQQVFYVYEVQNVTESNINKAEYFIDIDPGFGLAIPVPITIPGKDLSFSFQVNSGGLSQGFHTMVLRAHNELGRWGNTRQQVFYLYKAIPAVSLNVTGIEYFIDTDPGFGMGTPVDITVPASTVTADFIVDLSGLTSGDHVLYFRGKDALNRWSPTYAHAFSMTVTSVGKKEVMPWFRMYPNPNGGNFILDFNELQNSTLKITISDLNGRTVFSNELYGENIPLSVDLPTGIYLLKVEAGNKSFMQKLVINR